MMSLLQKLAAYFRRPIPSEVDYRPTISFALDQFVEGYDKHSDDEIYENILAYVGNEDIANQVFVFIPIALTREYLKNHPVKLTDYYLKSGSGKTSKKVMLKSLPVYNQILEVLTKSLPLMEEDDILKILVNSAEFKVINTYLKQGGRWEDLAISAPVTGA